MFMHTGRSQKSAIGPAAKEEAKRLCSLNLVCQLFQVMSRLWKDEQISMPMITRRGLCILLYLRVHLSFVSWARYGLPVLQRCEAEVDRHEAHQRIGL